MMHLNVRSLGDADFWLRLEVDSRNLRIAAVQSPSGSDQRLSF
jgi:hypothetical protein